MGIFGSGGPTQASSPVLSGLSTLTERHSGCCVRPPQRPALGQDVNESIGVVGDVVQLICRVFAHAVSPFTEASAARAMSRHGAPDLANAIPAGVSSQ